MVSSPWLRNHISKRLKNHDSSFFWYFTPFYDNFLKVDLWIVSNAYIFIFSTIEQDEATADHHESGRSPGVNSATPDPIEITEPEYAEVGNPFEKPQATAEPEYAMVNKAKKVVLLTFICVGFPVPNDEMTSSIFPNFVLLSQTERSKKIIV